MEEISRSFHTWLKYGTELLESKGIADADVDAWILMEYSANIDRTFYSMHKEEPMDLADARMYYDLLVKRAARIPVQYLTHEAWFYGHCFYVNPSVLIPRQDTETLVERAELLLKPGMKILDLCTGSGCILLSLLKDHDVTGTGSDISPEALSVARKNQELLGISSSRVRWICSDLFDDVRGTFDLITANPPYVAADEIKKLEPEVRDHEPVLALDGAVDGLRYEFLIAERARMYLKEGAWLLLEIGWDQGKAVKEEMERLGYAEVEIIRDLGGNDRVAVGEMT
ncbi:MAG: peptide chain release factor N(5)-glutamine methyltransferase [Eubacteriales bacterium]|jgi:release factor glutamine methyltransferase